jgi:predicted nuclease of predicted toxin-antitoxin system
MPEHRVIADEHIAKSVVRRLESYGIEASHIDEADLKGKSDHEIIGFAEEENYLILTRDDDFKQIAVDRSSIGILYLTRRLRKKKTA